MRGIGGGGVGGEVIDKESDYISIFFSLKELQRFSSQSLNLGFLPPPKVALYTNSYCLLIANKVQSFEEKIKIVANTFLLLL